MKFIYILLTLLVLLLGSLLVLRLLDWRADQAEWNKLASLQPTNPELYKASMVADLPESARRFFNFAIASGTPLYTVAEIDMGGQFSLGSQEQPNYQSMQAQQILAAPHGFVWRLKLPGIMPVSGSDAGGWTRFRILGIIPVARMGGDSDHSQSAFGRYVAEAVFWTPAALLPRAGVTWEGVDEDTARVTISHGELSQAVDVTVNAEGQAIEVSFMRWSNANPEKSYQRQPFGGLLSDFREVQGFKLPFRVEAGNMFGTTAFFPSYKAEVKDIRFVSAMK
ncbi:MAG: hypothetical protein DWP95_13555 [Proteobacteria bacterium]|nr:MAG: hypothetical protein DWP95_13555 [Pseudomonadota bacterium]